MRPRSSTEAGIVRGVPVFPDPYLEARCDRTSVQFYTRDLLDDPVFQLLFLKRIKDATDWPAIA
jgi:hypothetical protein